VGQLSGSIQLRVTVSFSRKAAADPSTSHNCNREGIESDRSSGQSDASSVLSDLSRTTSSSLCTPISATGTVLVREWDRRSHRVMVMADGFAWNGQTYDSLSKVAFAITGTKWSGPRFFGLRDKEDRSTMEARP
jgi:hypothetical protein